MPKIKAGMPMGMNRIDNFSNGYISMNANTIADTAPEAPTAL